MAFAIIREDMLDRIVRDLPTMMSFRTHVENNSMFNTPPVFPIYVLMETLRWLKSIGGVDEIYRRNKEKAALLYDEIDRNPLFRGTVEKEDRSLMNICFVMAEGCEELAPEFMEFAKARGHGRHQGPPSGGRLPRVVLQRPAQGERRGAGGLHAGVSLRNTRNNPRSWHSLRVSDRLRHLMGERQKKNRIFISRQS